MRKDSLFGKVAEIAGQYLDKGSNIQLKVEVEKKLDYLGGM